MSQLLSFKNLTDIATHLRTKLEEKKYLLLFAYNGTGKTRLSMSFKDLGKTGDQRDTLYFNAFTEDLFSWDNDLDTDARRVLLINERSRFFQGLQDLEMENRIRPILQRYADFDFKINYTDWTVNFTREVVSNDSIATAEYIKVSRGEENIFIWCFFLAIVQLVVDKEDGSPYNWVKYIYIDDPISSLDDNNAIAVASHLAHLLKESNGSIKTVISSHHGLFFNVIWNELYREGLKSYFLSNEKDDGIYKLEFIGDTPFYYHVAVLRQLHQAAESNQLYTYHFNILRGILEMTAHFHGFRHFSACIKRDNNDQEGILHARMLNVLSHGNYSVFEPLEMVEDNKQHFKKILNNFMANYRFNLDLFPEVL
jgi:wobble nucleotide-excising tRNase